MWMSPLCWFGGLPCDRAISARLRHDAFLSSDTFRNGQQSVVAVDIIALMDALNIQKATIGGFDWRANSRQHCSAMARALQGAGFGERLSDRQPGGRRLPLPPKAELNGGTNIISPPIAAATATTNTGTISRSSIWRSLRRNGISMMPRSIAPGGVRQPGSRRDRHP